MRLSALALLAAVAVVPAAVLLWPHLPPLHEDEILPLTPLFLLKKVPEAYGGGFLAGFRQPVVRAVPLTSYLEGGRQGCLRGGVSCDGGLRFPILSTSTRLQPAFTCRCSRSCCSLRRLGGGGGCSARASGDRRGARSRRPTPDARPTRSPGRAGAALAAQVRGRAGGTRRRRRRRVLGDGIAPTSCGSCGGLAGRRSLRRDPPRQWVRVGGPVLLGYVLGLGAVALSCPNPSSRGRGRGQAHPLTDRRGSPRP